MALFLVPVQRTWNALPETCRVGHIDELEPVAFSRTVGWMALLSQTRACCSSAFKQSNLSAGCTSTSPISVHCSKFRIACGLSGGCGTCARVAEQVFRGAQLQDFSQYELHSKPCSNTWFHFSKQVNAFVFHAQSCTITGKIFFETQLLKMFFFWEQQHPGQQKQDRTNPNAQNFVDQESPIICHTMET